MYVIENRCLLELVKYPLTVESAGVYLLASIGMTGMLVSSLVVLGLGHSSGMDLPCRLRLYWGERDGSVSSCC